MTKAKEPRCGAGSPVGTHKASAVRDFKIDAQSPSDPTRPIITLDPSLPTLLSVDATAVQLSVSTKTVRRLITIGALPSCRVGRLVRVRAVDLATFVASGTEG